MRLCSRANSVWIAVSAMFSFARTSPATTACSGCAGELAHQVDGRGGRRVPAGPDRREVVVGQEEGGAVVGGVPVDRADALPLVARRVRP